MQRRMLFSFDHSIGKIEAYCHKSVYTCYSSFFSANCHVLLIFCAGELSEEEMKNVTSLKAQNVRGKNRLPMPVSTRRALDNFFRPYNKRLAELLQDSKYAFES